MPLQPLFDPVILDTVLDHLAPIFLNASADDRHAARNAAHQLVLGYHPETEEELSLAAEIIDFRFHALEALSQAAEPGLSLNKMMRLRGSAVSLSRDCHKAQRKLDQLQRSRWVEQMDQAPAGTFIAAEADPASAVPPADLDTPARPPAIQPARNHTGKKKGKYNGLTWTQHYNQRQRDKRLAARHAREQARLSQAQPHSGVAAT